MIHRTGSVTIALAATLLAAGAHAADYRGMPGGWPYYYTGYAPTSGAAGVYYAGRPVTVAYANPAYYAAYGGAATSAYRPTVAAAYYAPAYAARPVVAYYEPATAQYAPSQSYAISPAGSSSAGSEAAAYYGQPTTLNYVPPQFSYRTSYAAVPVYMYRPVTAYDPVVGQPTTCMQPQVTSSCQPQRSRSWFSWLHPYNWGHSWFGSRSSCGYSGCGAPPTTAYCTSNFSQPQCGAQPYYPLQQQPAVIQGVPAQQGIPLTPIMPGGTYVPPAGPRVPSPPTRIGPGGTGAADLNPRLPPGTTIMPGTTIAPGTTITPGNSFPVNPTPLPGSTTPLPGSTTPLPSSSPPFPGGGTPGSFGTGTGYAPSIDPYQGSTPPPTTTIFGSGYRGSATETPRANTDGPVIRQPELNSPLPASVQPVPDLDARERTAPANRAPALLSPRDKTALRGDQRWAVVPAVWPASKPAMSVAKQVVQTKATEPAPVAASSAKRYDDSGWTSGRSW
jgi:hypothetical protein